MNLAKRIADLRAHAEHPNANPHEAAVARAKLEALLASEADDIIESTFERALKPLGLGLSYSIRWAKDAREGVEAAWYTEGSAGETVARSRWPYGGADRTDTDLWQAVWTETRARHPGVRSIAGDKVWLASGLVGFEAAWEAGLWAFWIMGREILAIPQPEEIKIEAARIHCATGPAVWWEGGASYYFWHGTVIPADWIEHRDQLAPEIALTWPNVEQRRVAGELIGWVRVIEKLPHRVIDTHPHPMVGSLISVDLPDILDVHFLKVKCGTGRFFVLCVPRDCRTAIEAQTAMWPGLSQAEVLDALTKGRRA